PDPGGSVERGLQAVAAVERSANTGLELENRSKPKRPKQDIPGGEAMIKGTGRRSEAFADGRNRHLRYASLGDDCQSRSDQIFLAIFGVPHVLRRRILDTRVNIFIPAKISDWKAFGSGRNGTA